MAQVWLEKAFIGILNMSLTGGIIILAVLVLRLFLKKAPKVISYCLWAVVLFRLFCPVSFQAGYSLLGALQVSTGEQGRITYISENISYTEDAFLNLSDSAATDTIDMASPQGTDAETDAGLTSETAAELNGGSGAAEPEMVLGRMVLPAPAVTAGTWIYFSGVLAMAAYSVVTLAALKRKLKTAERERDNIYITRSVLTPFVCGFFCPKIYLPSILTGEEKDYILLHEQIHIKRGDHIVKILSFLALSLHWFNPLVWAAFFLSGKDMEMACDEAVIRKCGSAVKKEYSTSLLMLATGRRIVGGIPLAFGEGDTGSRIKNVLRYKKPAAAVVGAAVVVSAIAAVLLLANPGNVGSDGNGTANPGSADSDGNGTANAQTEPSDNGNGEAEAQQVVVGVMTEVEVEGSTRLLVRIPGLGDVRLPKAKEIYPYFEPGEEGFTLEDGDLVQIEFPAGEDVALQEIYPAVFESEADSIVAMRRGFVLQYEGEDRYRVGFPYGIVPDGENAKAGDTLEIYFHAASGDGLPKALFKKVPILSVEMRKEIPTIYIELMRDDVSVFLNGLGNGDVIMERKGIEETESEEIVPGVSGEGTFRIGIRTLDKNNRTVDNYIGEDISSYEGGEALAFAEDCIFYVNYDMDGVNYEKVSFDTFADLINESDPYLNKPGLLTFEDNMVVEAKLISGYYQYGISPCEKTACSEYELLQEVAGEDVLEQYYTLVSTETMDIARLVDGEEIIEVYTGNIGDGDSGLVLFKNAAGKIIYTEFAHVARAGWNNVYLGETKEGCFIMTAVYEDRDDTGIFTYAVFGLGMEGEIQQIAGSSFEWQGVFLYDDELFKEWADGLSYYLENSHLLLSSQDGELRTDKVSEADKYNYDSLRRG